MKNTKFIFLGFFAGLLSLVLETIFSIIFLDLIKINASPSLFFSMPFMVIIEEIILFIAIGKIFQKPRSHQNAFLDALFIGFGFSLFEIFLNVFTRPESIFLSAYFGLIFIHTLTPLFYLFFFLRKKAFAHAAPFLFLGCLAHFIYNFSVWKEIDFGIINTILLSLISFSAFYFANNKSFLPNNET